jgi:biotin carboxyl carrier protein
MAYIATLGDQTHTIEVQELEADHVYRIVIDGKERIVNGRQLSAHMYSLLVEDQSFTIDVTEKDDQYTVSCEGKTFQFSLLDERRALRPGEGGSSGVGDTEVRSLMPGKIVEVLVSVGDEVGQDQGVLIMEAMKMENEVRASTAGTVTAILVAEGQAVEAGELLLELE